MKNSLRSSASHACVVALLGLSAFALTAQTPTSRIVGAANAFLTTLTETQRKSVLYAFDDEQQRVRWSNFPMAMVPRAGICFKEMTPAQLQPRTGSSVFRSQQARL